MTLHIYYRHTPVQRLLGKSRPPWFSHEKCFVNLLRTIGGLLARGAVELHLVFDGSAAAMQADFAVGHLDRLAARQPELAGRLHRHCIEGGDQRKAWRALVRLVRSHCDAGQVAAGDVLYLLENDYVHRPGWWPAVEQLTEQGIGWDYLTLYDHPDKYPNYCRHADARYYDNLRSRLFVTPDRHWRTAPSTCATYMLRRETFLRDYPLLRLGIYDFRLFRILTGLLRRRLLSPVPALATHSMDALLAPCVDWEAEMAASTAAPVATAAATFAKSVSGDRG